MGRDPGLRLGTEERRRRLAQHRERIGAGREERRNTEVRSLGPRTHYLHDQERNNERSAERTERIRRDVLQAGVAYWRERLKPFHGHTETESDKCRHADFAADFAGEGCHDPYGAQPGKQRQVPEGVYRVAPPQGRTECARQPVGGRPEVEGEVQLRQRCNQHDRDVSGTSGEELMSTRHGRGI